MDWISFYDFKHSVIYVNARHRDVHYRTIATDIAKLVPSPDARVMDYGCGEANSATILADACAHLTMVEAAPNVRGLDMIVLHSVAQYLSSAELDNLMATFRRLLKPTGTFVLGDIIKPRLAAPMAALALLRFGAENGFFWAAVGGLIRIVVSDYFKIKSKVGLSHYEEADMLKKLRAAGYEPARAPRNIGHNQQRMTFLARPLTGR